MIELQGTARMYRFDCSSTNALCRLEEMTGRPFSDVLMELRGTKPHAATVHAFVSALLVEDSSVSHDAGAVLDDIGGVAVIRRAARLAAPAKRRGKRAI